MVVHLFQHPVVANSWQQIFWETNWQIVKAVALA